MNIWVHPSSRTIFIFFCVELLNHPVTSWSKSMGIFYILVASLSNYSIHFLRWNVKFKISPHCFPFLLSAWEFGSEKQQPPIASAGGEVPRTCRVCAWHGRVLAVCSPEQGPSSPRWTLKEPWAGLEVCRYGFVSFYLIASTSQSL